MIRGSRTTIQEPAFIALIAQGSATGNHFSNGATRAKFVASEYVRWYNCIEGKTNSECNCINIRYDRDLV